LSLPPLVNTFKTSKAWLTDCSTLKSSNASLLAKLLHSILFLQILPQTRPRNPKDIPAMLRDLKGLLDDGIITEEEFLDKKRELLARL
jgi:predicted Zn-dependent peptidase